MSLSSLKIQLLPKFSLNAISNLAAAIYMLIGSTKALSAVKPTFGQFLLFLLSALGANILFAYLSTEFGAGSFFNEQGLISYLVWPVITLVAGIILAKRTLNYSLLFAPVILWLVADTFLVLLQSLIQFLDIQGWLPQVGYGLFGTLFPILFAWQTASLLWVFAKKLHWPWWERLLMLVASLALLVVWQKNIADQPIFKMHEQDPVVKEGDFYQQIKLLKATLDSVDKGRQNNPDWYFVGLAGFAKQDVFASEINQARQLFDVRFGTRGRSVALINNTNTWQSHPIATRTSLQMTLNTIASQMNVGEDVLFLALSSHGALDESGSILGDLVMDNPPMALDDIDPVWLRQALDDSGIRWRVIVVSSCYSGSFTQALSSPTTIVITASRADRASFGCSDDADMTYFGRAFFAEALRQQTTIESAFYQARRRVAEREALMGFEPSEPQISIGDKMREYLPQIEPQLFNAR